MRTKYRILFMLVTLLAVLSFVVPVLADGNGGNEPSEPPVEEPPVEEPPVEEPPVEEPPVEEPPVEEPPVGEVTQSFSAFASTSSSTVSLNPSHVGATNPGFGTGDCPTPPTGQEGWYGWHFIMPENNNFTSLTVTFQNAGTFSANPFPGVFVAHPDNSHAYIWTPTPDTLQGGTATSDGDNKFFNLSHVCAPAFEPKGQVKVTKTAKTTYTREHFWDIAKTVETQDYGYMHEGYPKIWLFVDGSGNEGALWTVQVNYKGYQDKDFAVSGAIRVENTGNIPARVDTVSDYIETSADIAVTVSCPALPATLQPGEKLECTYSSALPDGTAGKNFATASGVFLYPGETVFGSFSETGSAAITFDKNNPTTEIDKTVTVKDISDLYGEVSLGEVTAPNNGTFMYSKHFAWADYGADKCGDYTYKNTATIVETGQSASATLKVNVQCYIYETAYAKGDPATCFIPTFSNWGWTNPIGPGTYTWNLWAAAGQCNTNKGTLVGTVTVVYAGSNVTVTYNVGALYLLKETHVYAGTTQFPKDRRGRDTVAPGQYVNNSPFTNGGQVYVIAHAVVGIPDPNFGP